MFQKRPLGASGERFETTPISTKLQTIEALAYDWTTGNLFWVDSGLKKIEMSMGDGRYRRVIVNSTYLDNPRGLTLDPHNG